MGKREIKNAIITAATLGIVDRDILSAYLTLDYGGSGQAFGGYSLMLGPGFQHRNACEKGPNYAGIFIDKVLRIAGVEDWDQLVGRTIRADAEWGKVHAIGHIVKDEWFNPEEYFSKLKKEAA